MEDDAITVTQADIDAVKRFHEASARWMLNAIKNGDPIGEERDLNHPIYQAFALHRTTSLAAQDGLVEENERVRKLVQTYRGAQLRAEEKLCREQANAKGWKVRAERLEAKLAAQDGLVEALRHIRDLAQRQDVRLAALDAVPMSEPRQLNASHWGRESVINDEQCLQIFEAMLDAIAALSAIRENKS